MHTSEALKFIGETLGRGARHESEAEFEADLAEARRLATAARDAVETDADWRATLLLTLLLSKDKDRYNAMLMSSVHGMAYETVQPTIQQLYTEREVCAAELGGWLGRPPRSEAELLDAPCLRQAEQAAAASGLKR